MSSPTGFRVVEDGSTVTATFPAAWLRVDAGPDRTAAEALAERPSAVFAVNGAMFDYAHRPRFLLRDVGADVAAVTSEPDEGVTVWVERGVGGAAYGGRAPDGAEVAVQGWPSLVRDGAVSATNVGTNAERDTRVGVGLTADGRIVVVSTVGTMVQLAERMVAAGARWAGYLDGGSSLQLEGGGVRRVSSRAATVPVFLLAEPPVGGAPLARWTPARKAVVVGGAALAAVALLALWLDRRREEPAIESATARPGRDSPSPPAASAGR